MEELRRTTGHVFAEIKRVADEETNGDYKKAWEICWTRFIYG